MDNGLTDADGVTVGAGTTGVGRGKGVGSGNASSVVSTLGARQ